MPKSEEKEPICSYCGEPNPLPMLRLSNGKLMCAICAESEPGRYVK